MGEVLSRYCFPMSNLVPEKRVDKNGVLTTKHVRAVEAPAGTKSNLPAPSLSGAASKPSRAPSAETIVQRLRQREEELYGDDAMRVGAYKHQLRYIDKFPPALRQEIHDFIASSNKSGYLGMKVLIKDHYSDPKRFSAYLNTIGDIDWVSSCAGDTRGNGPERFRSIYERLELENWNDDLTQYHFDVIKAEHLATKLNISSTTYSVPHEYYGDLEALRKNFDVISPALPVVMAYKQARERVFTEKIQDPDLPQEERKFKQITAAEVLEVAAYANQYPEHITLIADTIRERSEFDRGLIDTMVGSGASAVAAGTL